jgi:hypothetical protein
MEDSQMLTEKAFFINFLAIFCQSRVADGSYPETSNFHQPTP